MRRLLFLDPAHCRQARNARLVVNPPRVEPVRWGARRPWEQMTGLYSTVIDVEGRLRLWYGCRADRTRMYVGYAESADGLHWTRPELGIEEFHGSRRNNLTNLDAAEGAVFLDPTANPAQRYGYVANAAGSGVYRWTSPDGLHWQRDAEPLLGFESDTQNVVFRDTRLRRYIGYARLWQMGPKSARRRKVGRWEAETLEHPLPIVPVTEARQAGQARRPHIIDELPVVFACDDDDPGMTDAYLLAPVQYPLDDRYYIGFPALYRHFPEPEEGPLRNEGRVEVHCAGSTDTIRWHRYTRLPYVSLGLPGSGYDGMVYPATGMVVRGDEIWQYGIGFHHVHGQVARRMQQGDGTLLRFVQRVDGFVSLDADERGGEITTVPMTVTGERLLLNLDAGALGEARVGLLDEEGQVIPGYAPTACDLLLGNVTGLPVTWQGRDAAPLRGQSVRLLIAMRRCKLYSARFAAAQESRPVPHPPA